MGSWYTTCALTNLPVLTNEEVYVFLLLESPNFEKFVSTHCYPSTYYNCLPFFFSGQYNDYGSVHNCQGALLEPIIIPNLRSALTELPLEENTVHDIEITRKKFDLDMLFEADLKSRLFLNAWNHFKGNEKARLTHVVVKKGVLDNLICDYKFPSIYPILPNKGYDHSYSFGELLIEANQFIETIEASETPEKSFGNRHLVKSFFGRTIYNSNGDGRWQHIFPVWRIVHDHIKSPLLPEIIRQMCVYSFLNEFMNNARRVWIKPSGAGSQDSETSAQLLLTKLTLLEIEKIGKAFED